MRGLGRWLFRWRARRRLRADLGIWYRPEYAMSALSGTARVPYLDVHRAERIAGALLTRGLVRAAELRRAEPATMQELLRVHHPDWLEAAAEPDMLARVLGLEPSHVPVDDVLRAHRAAVGGTIAAARAVAGHELRIGFNLGGGFHHAEPEQGSGFCVYNDVAVAIESLRAEGFTERIAVVELDYHQGNGTLVAFADDPSVLTWSIHGSVWTHVDAVADRGHVLPAGTGDAEYLELLERQLGKALRSFRPGLVVYVAGMDVLAGDRLGDFELTPAGVFERDRHVTELADSIGAGLVVTMAGGYSERAWRSTYAHLAFLLGGEPHVFEHGDDDLASRYERIARSLDPAELQRDHEGLDLTIDDVMGDLEGRRHSRRILGFYSRHGLELALERYGFFDALRGLGFRDFELDVTSSDPHRNTIRLEGRRDDRAERVLLIEIVLRLRERSLPQEALAASPDDPLARRALRLLSVEWLLLQDPTRPFSLERPPLPGQKHPGLGCAREVIELFAQVCKRLELDGAVNCPGHYHVALFSAGRMRFVDPADQGRFSAMRRVLADWPAAEASAAVAAGRLRLGDGSEVPWTPHDFVLPVSERLEAWLASERYRELCERERERLLAAGLRVEGPRGFRPRPEAPSG